MFTIALPTATTKKIYTQFGSALLDRIFTDDETKGRELSQYRSMADEALESLVAEVGKKTTPTKKAKKAKSPKGPSKAALKQAAMREALTKEYMSLNPKNSSISEDMTNKDIRKLISERKKAIKKEQAAAKKAAKAEAAAKAKAEKAAKKAQEKAAKKAAKGPSKRDIAKQALLKELSGMDSAHTLTMESSTKDIRSAIATLKKAAKAAAKAAMPKVEYKTPKRIADAEGNDFRNKDDTMFLRVKVAKATGDVVKIKPDTWTDEANARFDELYPNGKEVAKRGGGKGAWMIRRPKKTKAAKNTKVAFNSQVATSDMDLIAQLAMDAAKAELSESKVVAPKEKTTEPEEDDELTADDLSEIEDDSDVEEEEPEFPGEDDVEEFEHSLYPGQQLYLDEEHNVFNDEQEFIGKYDSETDTIEEA